MHTDKDLRLSNILVDWYNENKRDLPWRNTTNPYQIWLSEVILQQTRVDQGYAYYMRFVELYPTISDLAKAPEDDILKAWQGLGYYSRARNLHAAAKQICEIYSGVFPNTYRDILPLRGVGEYTAAAIASFAYNEPYAVVDGNVYRVLSRIFGIETPIDSTLGKKEFSTLAQEILNDKKPALHNQSIMEFGALQCTPTSPKCDICPASIICLALAQNKTNRYPVKQGKIKIRNRYFNYLDIRIKDFMYLNKRIEKDIWQNLYELPLIETEEQIGLEELLLSTSLASLLDKTKVKHIEKKCEYKHVLSHQIIHATFYKIDVTEPITDRYIKIKAKDAQNYPVSQLIHKYLLHK